MVDKQEITPYPDIRDRLTTFTIINCEHKDLFWRLIGHTAVVYKCQETGQLMVLESTTMNKATGVSGVQLTPMGLWLKHYPGKVFVKIPKFYDVNAGDMEFETANSAVLSLAEAFIKNHLGSSYPDLQTWSGRLKLILSALDLNIFGKDIFTYEGDDDGIFCTMLVIMFLQYCGLMGDKTIASEWQPDDTRVDFTMAHLLLNCKYGKEIQIK